MEGTTPNNTNQKNLDEVINELFESAVESGSEKDLETALRLIDAWNNDFTGEGEDITDKLPSLSEALQQREQIEKLQIETKKLKERQLPFGWTIESVKNLQEERDELEADNAEYFNDNEIQREEIEKLTEDIDRRSQFAQEDVARMARLSGLGYDITKDRNVNLDLMEKQIKENEKKLEEKIFDLENTDSQIADERLDEIVKLEGRIKELEDEKPHEELYNLQHENEKLKEEIQKFTSEIEMYGHPELLYKKSEKFTEVVKELACVRSQMDEEEERMKGFVNINIDGNGELPKEEEVKDCLGCRFARFREFHHTMWEDFQEEMMLHAGAKAQIPEKKGKRMTRADKVLLRDAWEDVKDRWGVAMAAVEDIENSPEGEKFKEKMALFARLLK